MRFLVRGSLHGAEAAQIALEALLRAGFPSQDVAFRSRFVDGSSDREFSQVYDPIGGARLSGRVTASMSATGFNLVGNSTLANTTLGDIGPLLSEVAKSENPDDAGSFQIRIDALVRANNRFQTKLAQDALAQSGATDVRVTPAD